MMMRVGITACFLFAMGYVGCTPKKSVSNPHSATSASSSQNFTVGSFVVSWDATRKILRVAHQNEPNRALWQNSASKNFVSVALDRTVFEQVRGSITVREKQDNSCTESIVESFVNSANVLTAQGKLFGGCKGYAFSLTFQPRTNTSLAFDLKIATSENENVRTFLRSHTALKEQFFGFGEQFSELEMSGKRLPILVQEQGHGRGLQPLSTAINIASKGSAGDWHTTYAPVPQFVSSLNRGFYLENYEPSVFDFTRANELQVEVLSNRVRGAIIYGSSPLEVISNYTSFSGRMRQLPAWVEKGTIVGLQGGEDFVRKTVEKLEAERVPISAIWIQDWVGQRHTTAGQRLWWNWEVDKQAYPNWEKLVSDFKQRGYRVLGYVNPFLSDASEKPGAQKNYFLEAKERGYLLKRANGSLVMIDTAGFNGAMVDLSNTGARAWLKNIIKQNLINSGLSGWMADFGEAAPLDSAPASGENALSFHARYVEEWAKINQEVLEESGLKEEGLFFLRAGFTRSPGIANLFWTGDQMVSWDEFDGIKTTVIAMMSSGFSGFSLNHSDIGGCIALTIPGFTFKRTNELLRRWMELNAFTPVFRTHEGTNPIKGGAQAYDSSENIAWLNYFSRIYAALASYRMLLQQEAAQKGWPVVRHPYLHYPNDPQIFSQRYEFMLGSEIIVAPVLDPGKTSTQVYLPTGRWTHIWSGVTYGSQNSGTTISIQAPLGKPAVFFKENSPNLAQALSSIQNLQLPKSE